MPNLKTRNGALDWQDKTVAQFIVGIVISSTIDGHMKWRESQYPYGIKGESETGTKCYIPTDRSYVSIVTPATGNITFYLNEPRFPAPWMDGLLATLESAVREKIKENENDNTN